MGSDIFNCIYLCQPPLRRRLFVPLHFCRCGSCLRGRPKMNLVISVCCGMMVVAKQSSRHKMWTKTTRLKYEREVTALRKGPDGCRMGADRPSHAGSKAFGSAARDRAAGRAGCDLVYRADRLSVVDAAEGLSSVYHRARLFLRLARRRLV